ncbi:MAG: DUF2911 domain-containing protein [Bergeyella sp.]
MKKIILTVCLTASVLVFSQDYSVPAASPREKIEQQFSISKISVDYGKPGVKGRKIFGELVPFGKVWRAGANSSTKITFGQPVNFGGKSVPAGTYALFILPTEKEWKIILNKDSQQWGAYEYNEKLDIASATVPVQQSAKQEWFTISLNPADENTTNLVISWDTSKAEVSIKTDNPEVVGKMVEKLKEAKKIQWEANKK